MKSETRKIGAIALLVIGIIISAIVLFNLVEYNNANQITVVQYPSGKLEVFNQPGFVPQYFGSITTYDKSKQFYFDEDDNTPGSLPLLTSFNDNGTAFIHGSIRWDMPIDKKNVLKLHEKFGTQDAIISQLIQAVMEKSIMMTGPLMSSKEAAAERKNELISLVEDQAKFGIYRTKTEQYKDIDQLSGKEKTFVRVDIIKDEKTLLPKRQEKSPIEEFGISLHNFSPKAVKFDETVLKQIADQQKITMQVQTSKAEALQAEQKAITAEKEGQAAAAKAKWEQEVVKAKNVTAAEAKKAVAELEVQTAELYKRKLTLEGEGEAAKKRAILQADGALEQKLAAWKEERKYAWEAFANYKGAMVPSIIMGGGNGGKLTSQDYIELMGVKAAKDLKLDLETK